MTDAATKLTGAAFGAFFYNGQDDQGKAYLLYALSGAPRSAFERFGHPRATPIFEPTFHGSGVVRLDDVTSDPRYRQWAPRWHKGSRRRRARASREVLERLLAEAGANVVAMADASQAREAMAREGRFDLLVSDIGMPGEDGYSFMRWLRRQTAPAGAIPSIALTAFARAEDVEEAHRAGFDAHHPKPVDPSRLVHAANSLLSSRTATR